MRTAGRRWAAFVLAVTATVGAFHAARAATSTTRFYDGATTGDVEETAWFAASSGKLYGTFVGGGVSDSQRLFSSLIAHGSYSGAIFNEANKKVGTCKGKQSSTTVSGSYSITGASGGVGDYSGAVVARNGAAMRSFAGTYRVPEAAAEKVALTLRFTKSGMLTANGTAKSSGLMLRVLSITGSYIIDGSGNLWLLPQKLTVVKLPQTSKFPIPRQGLPVKLAMQRSGKQIKLIDPFDNTRVFATLVRK